MFEYISAFGFTYEIAQTKTEKNKLKYWIGKSGFINSFRQQENITEPLA